MFNNKIILLVPAYNPSQAMVSLIEELHRDFKTIIVVDDGSLESSRPYFKMISDKAIVLRHERNMGKGASLKTGFRHILRHYLDAYGVVTVGADGQNDSRDVLRCCQEFMEDRTTTVYGCRDFLNDEDISSDSKLSNEITCHITRLYKGIDISDTLTTLRVFPIEILDQLVTVDGHRFDYDVNVVFRLIELGVSIKEVLVDVKPVNTKGTFSLNGILDTVKLYLVFLKFCMSSICCYVLDIVLFTLFKYILVEISVGFYIIEATILARVISGTTNYCINRLVFKTKNEVKSSGRRFLILWICQMCLSAFFVSAISALSPYSLVVIKMIVDFFLFLASYQIQRKWVFVNN